MNSALLFLLGWSWKNRVLARFRRLRSPMYLVSALAGLAYLYFVFQHQPFIHGSPAPHPGLPPDPGILAFVELAFTCMLMGFVIFQFFFSNARAPLFDEAEVQFLFPAPVSRGALIDYRLAKAQTGIVFGSLISLLIFGRGRLFRNPVFLLITVWAIYSLLYLYRTAVVLAKQGLILRGPKGRQIRRLVAAWILLTAFFLAASARWFYPAPPSGSEWTPESLVGWLKTITESGPVYYVLFPFRLLVHPAFAPGISDFLRRIVPVFVSIAAFYIGIRRSNAGFEVSALGQTAIEEISASGSRDVLTRKPVRKPRRPPFRLEPGGFPPMAIYWKNLSLAGGLSMRQALPAIVVIAAASILLAGTSGETIPIIIGSTCAALAGFLTLMGPVLFRDDLRTDLRNADLLKTYPIPGWGIVLGEVLGPSTVLTILQWAMLLVAAGTLPSLGEHPWTMAQRIYLAVGAALLMPCLSFIGILVQNATVLLLPGWIQLGKEHQRGVEAMGQRLISSLATILSLLIAALPAALLFLATWAAGYWLIGTAVFPIASLAAALGLLVEGALGVLWLGRLFERFDPSSV